MTSIVAPNGAWKSPVTPSLLTASGVNLSHIQISNGMVFWLEGRPAEAGRTVVVRRARDGTTADVLPAPFNARSRVHEYGGGAYAVYRETIFFSQFDDQRVYRLDPGSGNPWPITPAPLQPAALRYSDFQVTPDGLRLICVRESHKDGLEPVNEIVAFASDGSSEPEVLVTGADFYSFPRISPNGTRLAWTCWNHPQMPWDGTELWAADLLPQRGLAEAQRIAGGPSESIFQPEWSPEGVLHFISDCTGWWNLYSLRDEDILPLAPMNAEFGMPQWVSGISRYAFLAGGRIACIYSRDGLDQLGIVEPNSNSVRPLDMPYDTYGDIRSDADNRVFLIAASASAAPAIVSIDVRDGRPQVLRRSMQVDLDPEDLSAPEPIEFPTDGNLTAFALYYAPKNREFSGPAHEKPPLLVLSHGGPTTAASSALKLAIQFWTSRGFAVVDVNYGGSSGYGRAYRERLNGQWGIVDVQDCTNAAKYLADRGDVDPKRMAIHGGSAGGYTTLCALVFTDVFAAGASHYGIADLETLATDTHKFEARYMDGLVGPYPEAAGIYRQRSPIHFTDRLACPVIVFQGLQDKVVPPAQAEKIVAALRGKGLPFATVVFPDEGHGFRQAASIERAAEAELYFYSRVFGFTAADAPEPVTIENDHALKAGGTGVPPR